jgi:DNA-directed RNA polymerase specialized sigma24 family protein
VTLRMLEELSGEVTAARLGLTPGHVAVLLHRSKRDLAACVRGLSPAEGAVPAGSRSRPGRGRPRRS